MGISDRINNVTFADCGTKVPNTAMLVYTGNCKAPLSKKHLTIARLSDSGGIDFIYRDTVCKQYPLQQFSSPLSFSDFNVEKLSQQKFCEDYITAL